MDNSEYLVRLKRQYRLTPLVWFIALLLLTAFSVHAQEQDYFNSALLEIDNSVQGHADLSAFEAGAQAPGVYHVDIYINDDRVDTRDVVFHLANSVNGKQDLQPCLSAHYLAQLGIKTTQFPGLSASQQCADLSSIPQAKAEFQFSIQRLQLSIPQAALVPKIRGYVAPEQWSEGINAFLLNYSLTGDNTTARNGQQNSNSQYVNLRPGINFGPWRIRNYTTWNRNNTGQGKWDTAYTYIQRDIIALKSQFTLGEGTSASDVFDSVPFRGAQLASDDDMLPDSLKGYAPVVRGIARTNAQVIIRQNGYIIYQSYVAPGAFEINDMFPTGGSGDLNVTIKEADGSEQHLIVPFSSLPVLQREGRLKYSLTTGQYRSSDRSVENTPFTQGTAIYGLPHNATIYSGAQFAGNYQSFALGVGQNLGDFGAISTDITQAWSTPQDSHKESGQSWRIRYSKDIITSGTNFALAGYRYSTGTFYNLQEVMDSHRDNTNLSAMERRRNRAEATMTQNLWEGAGSLSLNLISEDYWNSQHKMQSASVGYNNGWHGISYGMTYTYSRNVMSVTASNSEFSHNAQAGDSGRIYDKDQIFALNISIPFDIWSSNTEANRTFANYSLNTSKNGHTSQSAGLNGSMLADNNLNWSVQQGHDDQGYTGNLNADYKGTYSEITAGHSYDRNSRRLNYGLQGGVLVHENGITLGQTLGETIALVKAPGADGIGINNQTGVKTDFRGYALVPYLSPYRKNDVTLDTEALPDNVEISLTSESLIPTRGAVVRANYMTNVGQRVLMTLSRADHQPIPFGAIVTVQGSQNTQAAIVDDAGPGAG